LSRRSSRLTGPEDQKTPDDYAERDRRSERTWDKVHEIVKDMTEEEREELDWMQQQND